MYETTLVEKIKTQFRYNNFFSKNRVIYEMMWKNIVQQGRPQMTIWRIACWATKAKNTHTHNM